MELDFEEFAEWRNVAPQARVLWRAGGIAAIVGVAAIGAVAGGLIIGPAAALAVAVAAVLCIPLWWVLVGRRWRAWGYAERDDDLLIRRGVLFQQVAIVPYGRMQFVEMRQGPLDRWLAVATVQLHTAAAATDASIPLLPSTDAQHLRDRLAALGEARAAGL
ncbi:MAG TPA: PH domain-containing protein [Acidimicrobiales bacterium]|jgi:membrane protein YdbS with pleckstrin-like domain